MSVATIFSRAQTGIQAQRVLVEVHISNGLPNFSIVGLPETAVRESKDRVRAAIINSNFEFPARRITVNLAPAELPKQGGRFDLPIALGLLLASQQLNSEAMQGYEFLGELSLSGELRKTVGMLPAAYACQQSGSILITSIENQSELLPIKSSHYLCASHLLEVCAHLNNIKTLDRPTQKAVQHFTPKENAMQDVYGQHHAKRALTIAAAGSHHVLMVGSPGSGKSMLASRFPGLLTAMSDQEMLETSSLYSIANVTDNTRQLYTRPFRAPHHTVSAVGLAGGGSNPKPGEISLAHNGVLFLDEFTEFDRRALEILREPIETGSITISRANAQVEFPARFQLIAAMNPCPNGCDLDQYGQCECSNEQLNRYKNKISAPLLDRIDLQVSVPKLPSHLLFESQSAQKENWQDIILRIHQAYAIQLQRQGKPNRFLSNKEIKLFCYLNKQTQKYFSDILDRMNISARVFHRLLKVSRTIADLEQVDEITQTHLSEAMSYRQLDRFLN